MSELVHYNTMTLGAQWQHNELSSNRLNELNRLLSCTPEPRIAMVKVQDLPDQEHEGSKARQSAKGMAQGTHREPVVRCSASTDLSAFYRHLRLVRGFLAPLCTLVGFVPGEAFSPLLSGSLDSGQAVYLAQLRGR